ncbi:MAG: hypothetical protein Q9216_006514 [Gyalolechia sp. 2 TL-2023]
MEPPGPGHQGSSQSHEVDEANTPFAMRTESGPWSVQAEMYLRPYPSGAGPRSSTSEVEPDVMPELDPEKLIDRNRSLYAFAEHGSLMSQAFVSGHYLDDQGTLPFQGLPESLLDENSTDEQRTLPREEYESLIPKLRGSCGQQRTDRSRVASRSTNSAIKRPISSREWTDEDRTDFPIDHDHLAEERPQVLRRSRRRTNQSLRHLPKPNSSPLPTPRKHHQIRNADAADSPNSRDMPQVQHALLSFTRPAYGKITVEIKPLGPARPTSITPQGQLRERPEQSFPSDMKRRRVTLAEDHSSTSQSTPAKIASALKSGYHHSMQSIGAFVASN